MTNTELLATPPLSLLVVEDSRDVAESLAFILQNCGYNVSIAYDGDQAVKMVDATPFQIVICDIGLPGRSGYEVASHIRRIRGKDPLVIAVSAYSSESVRENARIAGFDQFFSKPADPLELEKVLSDRVSSRSVSTS
ncbi:MAG: response regulator [Planctomycetes bacterium]|nr:response regulator [Planctomycetota bacterium]